MAQAVIDHSWLLIFADLFFASYEARGDEHIHFTSSFFFGECIHFTLHYIYVHCTNYLMY